MPVRLAACLMLLVAALLLRLPRAEAAEAPYEVVDLHVDVPWQLHYKKKPLDMSKGMVTRKAMAEGHVAGLVLPFYIPDKVRPSGPEAADLDEILATVEKVIWQPGSPFLPLPHGDTSRRQVRGWLALEGAQALAADPDAIGPWVQRGVRLVGLAHGSDNDLAGSATGKRRKGFSEKGKKLARKAIEAGAALDVSHLSDASFDDAAALSKELGVPIVATHSNARAVCKHPRNLTDAQLKAIGASGGVAGLNLHAPYLSTEPDPGIEQVIAQLDHMIKMAGEDSVAIGSDYDGGITPPRELPDAASFPRLARALRKRGYSEERVRKIFSGNALRVLQFTSERAAR